MSNHAHRSLYRKVPIVVVVAALAVATLPASLAADTTTPGLPDLVVSQLVVVSRADGTFHFHGAVTNVGNASAGKSLAKFSVDGKNLTFASVPPLGPGGSANVTSDPWRGANGTHVVVLEADAAREVRESREDNNRAARQFEVRPPPDRLPDLVVDDLQYSMEPGPNGWSVRLKGIVRNAGDGMANASVARFLLDGRPVGDWDVPPLYPGERAAVYSKPTPATEGRHLGELVADATGKVAESNEWNNHVRIEFDTTPPKPPTADLSIRIVGIEKARLRTDFGDVPNPVGRRVIVTVVCNAGPEAAFTWAGMVVHGAGPVTVANVDWVHGPSFDLEAGACREVRLPWDPIAFGDVTYTAFLTTVGAGASDPPYARDPDWSNNVATANDFVGVGGTGIGYVFPLP